MIQAPDKDILTLVPVKNPDYEFDDEYLVNIVNPQDTLFVNGPTAMVWAQCDGQTNIGAMIDELHECFPEDGEIVSQDTVAAIMMLAERGAVTLNPPVI